jgi:hypothetical protein
MTDPQPWPRNCDIHRTNAIKLSHVGRDHIAVARLLLKQGQLRAADTELADATTALADIETAMVKARQGLPEESEK